MAEFGRKYSSHHFDGHIESAIKALCAFITVLGIDHTERLYSVLVFDCVGKTEGKPAHKLYSLLISRTVFIGTADSAEKAVRHSLELIIQPPVFIALFNRFGQADIDSCTLAHGRR